MVSLACNKLGWVIWDDTIVLTLHLIRHYTAILYNSFIIFCKILFNQTIFFESPRNLFYTWHSYMFFVVIAQHTASKIRCNSIAMTAVGGLGTPIIWYRLVIRNASLNYLLKLILSYSWVICHSLIPCLSFVIHSSCVFCNSLIRNCNGRGVCCQFIVNWLK